MGGRCRQTYTLQAQDILQRFKTCSNRWPGLAAMALHAGSSPFTPPWNHGPVVHEQGFSVFIFVSNWEQNHPAGLKIPTGPSSILEHCGLAKMSAPFLIHTQLSPRGCSFTLLIHIHTNHLSLSLPQKYPCKIQVPPHGLQNPFLWRH